MSNNVSRAAGAVRAFDGQAGSVNGATGKQPARVCDAADRQPVHVCDATGRKPGKTVLEVSGLSCGYGKSPLMKDVSFTVSQGEILILLGPNGVGKTTLFKSVLGFLPLLAGQVFVDGQDVAQWTRRDFAQKVAYVPQFHDESFGFTVRELMLMGRTPKLGVFGQPGKADQALVEKIAGELGISHLLGRPCTMLSGGELQMALIGRALAQEPQLLVMDEPCASLDLGNQVTVLDRMKTLAKTGLAMVVTSHDPNHAFYLQCSVLRLKRGEVAPAAEPAMAMNAAALSQLYGCDIGIGTVTGASGVTVRTCAPCPADATDEEDCRA